MKAVPRFGRVRSDFRMAFFDDMTYCVYILASKRNGTLYTGVTGNLKKRVYEHKHGIVRGFTKKYSVHMLVYFQIFHDPRVAIENEKRIKEWKRAWKIELIEKENPTWKDLYGQL